MAGGSDSFSLNHPYQYHDHRNRLKHVVLLCPCLMVDESLRVRVEFGQVKCIRIRAYVSTGMDGLAYVIHDSFGIGLVRHAKVRDTDRVHVQVRLVKYIKRRSVRDADHGTVRQALDEHAHLIGFSVVVECAGRLVQE